MADVTQTLFYYVVCNKVAALNGSGGSGVRLSAHGGRYAVYIGLVGYDGICFGG